MIPPTSLLSLLSALFLAFTVLSSGQAKLTSRYTPEAHFKQTAKDSEESPIELYIPFEPSTRRIIHGIVNVLCGILLLLPSTRAVGAAMAFGLLLLALGKSVTNGVSVIPPLGMMVLCAVVWFV